MKKQIFVPSDFDTLGFLITSSFTGTNTYKIGDGIDNFDLGYEEFYELWYTKKHFVKDGDCPIYRDDLLKDLNLSWDDIKTCGMPINELSYYKTILLRKGIVTND